MRGSLVNCREISLSFSRTVLSQTQLATLSGFLSRHHHNSHHHIGYCHKLISHRIEFKVAALTYERCSTFRPAYLHSLLSDHISEFTAILRSASQPLLHELELSTAVTPSLSLHQLYETVCLLTLLTLHH